VSIFRNTRTDKGSTRRVRLRHLLPLALLAVVPILLAPAGSAKPPVTAKFEICVQDATSGTATPPCSPANTVSTFHGNSVATVQLSVVNDKSSTVQIANASIVVPPQFKVVTGSAAPSKNVSSVGQTISFTGLNLPGGKSFTATFSVDVACGGQGVWDPAQQHATDGGSTSFTYAGTALSTGVPSNITTACHLAFINQPTDTQSGKIIRDGGASAGDPTGIHVGLFDESDPAQALTTCPVGYANCSVSIGSQPLGVNAETQSLDSNAFVASFADLSISIPSTDVADQFNLVASPTEGSFVPPVTSSSFLIAQTVMGLQCPGSSCTTGNGHQTLSSPTTAGLADSFVDVSSSNGFTFMTLSPFTLAGSDHARTGCQGLAPLGVTGFAESDARQAGSGTLTIKYYVNKDILTARYGQNYGNQFAPMCVGARPVDTVTGQIHDCGDQGPWNKGGWMGDIIVNGKFKPGSVAAMCDSDGYYWGIISSYQDKLDATKNPVVTSWGGQNINGANYREFDMSIPDNWDYRGGP